jgi:hypothetical protein
MGKKLIKSKAAQSNLNALPTIDVEVKQFQQDLLASVREMKEEYDFSKSRNNPYVIDNVVNSDKV